MPSPEPPLPDCTGVAEVLSRVGDKWSVQVVVVLHRGAERFNGIKRSVPGISQQMLTRTLKNLERDGLINRTVRATKPIQVEYTLTALGMSLAEPVCALASWAIDNRAAIRDSRAKFDGDGGRDPAS
jgi:DNA-binding HxlR family transcriptional regulator